MSSKSYFPNTQDGQIVWLSHYNLKLPIYGSSCGITDVELASTQIDLAYYIWMLQHWHPSIQRDAKESTAYKIMMISDSVSGDSSINYPQSTVFPDAPPAPAPGIQKRLISQVVRIKAGAKYTEAIGHDLGIIASSNTVEHLTPDPSISVELGESGQRVVISFNKYGHEGVWIEVRINGGEWVFLAIDTLKPYYDERPLAEGNTHETREYRLRWWDKSVAHGEWSSIQSILLGL